MRIGLNHITGTSFDTSVDTVEALKRALWFNDVTLRGLENQSEVENECFVGETLERGQLEQIARQRFGLDTTQINKLRSEAMGMWRLTVEKKE